MTADGIIFFRQIQVSIKNNNVISGINYALPNLWRQLMCPRRKTASRVIYNVNDVITNAASSKLPLYKRKAATI